MNQFLIIFKSDVKLQDPAISFSKVDEKAYFLPNVSNFLVFGTDNLV